MGDHKAFFYGTLMAPAVLHRVCHSDPHPPPTSWQAQSLTIVPAVLHGHRRHRVRSADYPAIVPTSRPDASSVRGTFVDGLTDGDLWRLDIFEGPEYARRKVKVRLLRSSPSEGHGLRSARSGTGILADSEGTLTEGGEEVEAETYIWTGPREALEDEEWDFEEFRRDKMRRWVGEESSAEYCEVDEAVAARGKDPTGGKGLNGRITKELEEDKTRQRGILQSAV